MIPLICAIACGFTNIGIACSSKGAQSGNCRIFSFGVIGSGIACFSSLACIPFFAGPSNITGVWIIGIVMGILFFAAMALGVYANSKGPPSITWSITNMGLLVPIAMTALFFGEALHRLDYLLLTFFILMLVSFHRGIAKAKDVSIINPFGYAMLMVAVFFVNGFLMFCFKLNSIYFPEANKACLLVAMYGCGFLLFTLAMLFHRQRNIRGRNIGIFQFPELKWGIISGVSIGITQILMQEAMELPAIVSFPVIQGLSLLGGVALTSYIYHENFNIQKTAGVTLGLAVVLLSVAR
jgi:multidrug transporter EmrE-like cation transporter